MIFNSSNLISFLTLKEIVKIANINLKSLYIPVEEGFQIVKTNLQLVAICLKNSDTGLEYIGEANFITVITLAVHAGPLFASKII